MTQEQKERDNLLAGAELISVETIRRRTPIHSCAECGLDTNHPGMFCEMCSDNLDVTGREVCHFY